MNEFESKYLERLETELENEKIQRMQGQSEYTKLSAFSPNKDLNLVEYQLDLKEEIDRIQHLLSGHVLKRDKNDNEVWTEPDDDRDKIFSDYGVRQIMNLISFYINKNTLLSNYAEDVIWWKVRDFGIELSDLIMNRYESFFYYPSPEELYEKYVPIVKRYGLNISDEELYQKCIKWSNDELESKCVHFPSLILALIDSVHSAYMRAFKGEERKSLRQFIHVSQSTNQQPQMMQQPTKFSAFKPSTWGAK